MDTKTTFVVKFFGIILAILLGATIILLANRHQIAQDNIEDKVTKIWNKYLDSRAMSSKVRDEEIEKAIRKEEIKLQNARVVPRYEDHRQLIENIKKFTIEKKIGKEEQRWLKSKDKDKSDIRHSIATMLRETEHPVQIKNQQLRKELIGFLAEEISYLYEGEAPKQRIDAAKNRVAQLKAQSLADETIQHSVSPNITAVPAVASPSNAAPTIIVPTKITITPVKSTKQYVKRDVTDPNQIKAIQTKKNRKK